MMRNGNVHSFLNVYFWTKLSLWIDFWCCYDAVLDLCAWTVDVFLEVPLLSFFPLLLNECYNVIIANNSILIIVVVFVAYCPQICLMVDYAFISALPSNSYNAFFMFSVPSAAAAVCNPVSLRMWLLIIREWWRGKWCWGDAARVSNFLAGHTPTCTTTTGLQDQSTNFCVCPGLAITGPSSVTFCTA